MSKQKTYNNLADFAKEWKKENPTPKSERKVKPLRKVEKPTDECVDDRTDVIRIPV